MSVSRLFTVAILRDITARQPEGGSNPSAEMDAIGLMAGGIAQ
jgi:hypothetical protein